MAITPPDWTYFVTDNGIDWVGYDEYRRLRHDNYREMAIWTARAAVTALLVVLIWWI